MANERGGGVGKAVGASLGALGLLFARSADDCARLGARSAHVASEGAALGKGVGAFEGGARLPRLGGAAEELGAARVGARAVDEAAGIPRAARETGELGAFKAVSHLDDVGHGHSLEEHLLEELPDLAVDLTSYVLDDADAPDDNGQASRTGRATADRGHFRFFGEAALLPLDQGLATEATRPGAPGPRVLAPASSADDVLARVVQNKVRAPFTVLGREAPGDRHRWVVSGGEIEARTFFERCDRWALFCAALVCEREASAACEGAALRAWQSAASPLSIALTPDEVETQAVRFLGALLQARASQPDLAGLTLLRLARGSDERGYVVRISPPKPAPPASAAPSATPSPKGPRRLGPRPNAAPQHL